MPRNVKCRLFPQNVKLYLNWEENVGFYNEIVCSLLGLRRRRKKKKEEEEENKKKKK